MTYDEIKDRIVEIQRAVREDANIDLRVLRQEHLNLLREQKVYEYQAWLVAQRMKTKQPTEPFETLQRRLRELEVKLRAEKKVQGT